MTRLVLLLVCALLLSASANAQYHFNRAGIFNGTSSYISVGNHADLRPASGITVEAWIYLPDTLTSTHAIYGKNYTYSTGLFLMGQKPFFIPIGQNKAIFAKNDMPVKKWTHLAATYDGANTAIYVNGIRDTVATSISGPIGVDTNAALIGADWSYGSPSAPTYFFKGWIDELRVWKKAKTQAQIVRDMYVPLAISRAPESAYDSLVACYRLNGNAYNEGGAWQKDGIEFNMSYVDLGTSGTNYIDYNGSLVLAGAGYVAAPPDAGFQATTAITLEAWVRMDITQPRTSYYPILCKSNTSNRSDYDFGINPAVDSCLLYFGLNNESVYGAFIEKTSLARGQWTHLAVTYKSATGKMKFYVNGDSMYTANIPGSPVIASNSDSLLIGRVHMGNNWFKGQIDQARIWKNIERTGAEIRADMYTSLDAYSVPAVTNCIVYGFDGSNYDNVPSLSSNYPLRELHFRGDAYISSSHRQMNARRTSPLLRDDAGHFADPHYWNVSRHRLNVPDNRPEGALDSIYVDQAGTVTDPKAFLLFNHSWVSDIWAYLTSPAGTTITLIPRTGASYNDLMTFFTDAADSLVTDGLLPPFSPRVRPIEPLAGLISEPIMGWWKIQVVDAAPGDSGYVSGWGVSFGNITSTPGAEGVAERFELMQNYPNPFNPATTISFSLPEESHVTLVVYNLLGQEVATVVNGDLKAGVHRVQFHAAGIASGVYFYRLVAKNNVQVRKMMLLK